MATLVSLGTIPAFTQAIRTQLKEYWITSAEEFVSTAIAGNTQFGSGLAALGHLLELPEAEMMALVRVGQAALPPAMAFPVEAELLVGTGAIFEGVEVPPETSFDLPLELPTEKSLADGLHAPRNQGERNTCVAFALAAMVEQITGQPDFLSPQFIYWACKQEDGLLGDIGTRPDTGISVIQKLGVCAESVWRYDPMPNERNPGQGPPPASAAAEARTRRATGATQLPARDVLQIKATIAQGNSVMIGMIVSEQWTTTWQARTLGRVRKPLPGEAPMGGHAMLAVGYRDDDNAPGGGYFIVRNSWGDVWGRENPDGAGYGHIPYQLIAEQNMVAFAITGIASSDTDTVMRDLSIMQAGTVKSSTDGQPNLLALLQEAKHLTEGMTRDMARLESVLRELSTALRQNSAGASAEWPKASAALSTTPAKGRRGPLVLVHPPSLLTPNGILATTGQPLLMIDTEGANAIAQENIPAKKEDTPDYYLHQAKINSAQPGFGTVWGYENDIGKAGWAVVVNADDD